MIVLWGPQSNTRLMRVAFGTRDLTLSLQEQTLVFPKVVYNPAQTAAVNLDLAPLAVKIADNLQTSAHPAPTRYPA